MNIGKIIKKRFKEASVARVVVFAVFIVYAFMMVYALVWAATGSLKEHVELITNPNTLLPQNWLFKNYIEAFSLLSASGNSLISMIFNSLWLTFFSSMISVAVSCMAAYVMARYEFVGKKFIMFVLLTVLMIPLYASQASGFKLIRDLGIYDSPLFLIKSASAVGSIFFILRSFFMTLPAEYSESAQLDGAGHMRVFLTVMLPIALPAVLSIMLICFVGGWNDYMTPIMYLPSYPTLASGLYVYETVAKFNMNKPVYLAGVVMCAIPPLLLFIIFREKFMTNVSIGGLKG